MYRIASIATVVLCLLLLALFITQRLWKTPAPLRFSTGSELGVYNTVGTRIAEVAQQERPDISVQVQQSSGSQENILRLEQGTADIAIVQNDSIGGDGLQSLAALYPEVLHLACRKEANILCLNDLVGKRTNLGAKDSGTFQVVTELLNFSRIDLQEINLQHQSFQQASEKLRDNQLDAAFFLVGIGAQVIENLMQDQEIELVPIRLADPKQKGTYFEPVDLINGFQVHYPYASYIQIPMMTYAGRPQTPIASVGVNAVLVARSDLSYSDAKYFTETLFAQRAVLGREIAQLSQLDEASAQAFLQFPIHPGAEAYYHRNDPGFLAENAESIGLIVTLLLLGFSGLHSAHRWYAQRRKNHVDTYYQRIKEILLELSDQPNRSQLLALESELEQIEAAACEELIDERLDADDTYIILQNMLKMTSDRLANAQAILLSPEPSRE